MVGNAVSRTTGLAVGVVGALAFVVTTASRSARPPDRLSADIHTEYVKFPSGRDTITAYLAYPERKDPAPVIVVIHEIFGMSDFIRQTTEQLAKDGGVPPRRDSRSGGPGRPGGRYWFLLGRRPELSLRDEQPVPRRVRRLLRAGSRRPVHRAHPRQGTRRLRRERRTHQRRPGRRGRGDPHVPQDLPLYRVSRRRPRFPASPGKAGRRGQRVEGGRGILQGESGALGRRKAGLEVFTRLLQRGLVSREQVVHRPYHDEMRLHAHTGEPRAVGSLVAGDRELHAPALRECEGGHVSRTPARRLPDDEAATGGAERGEQVFRRSGRGARHQRRDRAPV